MARVCSVVNYPKSDFATFSAIQKALMGRMWPAGHMLCRPDIDKHDDKKHTMRDTVLLFKSWLLKLSNDNNH